MFCLTSSIRACGEWQKNEWFSVGEASRQSCWSQALGLYMNIIEADKWPSYTTWKYEMATSICFKQNEKKKLLSFSSKLGHQLLETAHFVT